MKLAAGRVNWLKEGDQNTSFPSALPTPIGGITLSLVLALMVQILAFKR